MYLDRIIGEKAQFEGLLQMCFDCETDIELPFELDKDETIELLESGRVLITPTNNSECCKNGNGASFFVDIFLEDLSDEDIERLKGWIKNDENN